MGTGLDALQQLLTLESVDETTFRGPASQEDHVRAFGGQVAAQAVMAAGLTVDEDRAVNSLHAYFIRPGSPDSPIDYQVERVRDGRSFSTRRVRARQKSKEIFEMSISFHVAESGVTHQDDMPPAPNPNSLDPFEQRFAGREQLDMARWFERASAFDIRYVRHTPFEEPGEPHAHQQLWVKTADALDAPPLMHAAIFTYVSDMTVLDAILLRHGLRWTDRAIIGASLDHALWFHQPFRVDEWLLLDQESPVAVGGRGLARGRIWDQRDRLVASVAQEALMRAPHRS